jgi:hypothetical protein
LSISSFTIIHHHSPSLTHQVERAWFHPSLHPSLHPSHLIFYFGVEAF